MFSFRTRNIGIFVYWYIIVLPLLFMGKNKDKDIHIKSENKIKQKKNNVMSPEHISIREFIYPPTYSENNVQTVFLSPRPSPGVLALYYLFAKSLSGPASSRCHHECLLIYGTTSGQCEYCHEHYTHTFHTHTHIYYTC